MSTDTTRRPQDVPFQGTRRRGKHVKAPQEIEPRKVDRDYRPKHRAERR